MNFLKILIADDHKFTSYALQTLLVDIFNKNSIEFNDAKNGHEVINLLKVNNYDLLVLDMNMPETDIFGLVTDIHNFYPNIKTLIFSMNSEFMFGKRLLKLGVRGFLPKNADLEELKKCFLAVMDGQIYLSQNLKEHLASESIFSGNQNENPFNGLSNREIQVAQLLIEGLSIDEIRKRLNVHPSSISTHKIRIFTKLNVKNIVELTQLANSYEFK